MELIACRVNRYIKAGLRNDLPHGGNGDRFMKEKANALLRDYLIRQGYSLDEIQFQRESTEDGGGEDISEIIDIEGLRLQEENRLMISRIQEYTRQMSLLRDDMAEVKKVLAANSKAADYLTSIYSNIKIMRNIMIFWVFLAAVIISAVAYGLVKLMNLVWKYL